VIDFGCKRGGRGVPSRTSPVLVAFGAGPKIAIENPTAHNDYGEQGSGGRKSPIGVQGQSPGSRSRGQSPPKVETLLLNKHAIFIAYLNKNHIAYVTSFRNLYCTFCDYDYTFCAPKHAILGSGVGRGLEVIAFLCTFYTTLRSTGCDMEGLEVEGGLKIEAGAQHLYVPMTLTTAKG